MMNGEHTHRPKGCTLTRYRREKFTVADVYRFRIVPRLPVLSEYVSRRFCCLVTTRADDVGYHFRLVI